VSLKLYFVARAPDDISQVGVRYHIDQVGREKVNQLRYFNQPQAS
jgi:hypothetical protein